MRKIKITKVNIASNSACEVTDYVAEEKPLHIFLNKTHYLTILCSPSSLKELAVGHLFSEGVVKSLGEIDEVDLKNESVCHVRLRPNVNTGRRLQLSGRFFHLSFAGCREQPVERIIAKCPKIKSSLSFKAEVVQRGVSRLNTDAKTFRKTGGAHAAAVYTCEGALEAFAEDVGRLNAVDKVIGIGVVKDTDFRTCFLALSGRLTGDIVFKAARVGLPVVASLAAAIDSGVTAALNARLTLIGFIRGNSMNVYSVPERIIV